MPNIANHKPRSNSNKHNPPPKYDPAQVRSSKMYGRRWRALRERFLNKNPLCAHCKNEGRVVAAKEVDHIVPHLNDMKLFYDEANLQALCKSHHSRKTAAENGGFGNKAR